MNISNIKAMIIPKANRGMLYLNKHSPEILLGTGIFGMLTSTYLGCRATLKFVGLKKDFKESLDILNEQRHMTKEEYIETQRLLYAKYFVELLRIYGPTIALSLVSAGMLLGGHRILHNRYTAIGTAYALMDEAYKKYRDRVKKELGEDADSYFRFKKPLDKKLALKKELKLDEIDNVLPGELVDDEEAGISVPSMYHKFFNKDSIQWREDSVHNETFLRAQQTFLNQLLHTRGHVFLNEVYDALGVPRTDYGAIVGWVDGYGDSYIDFDMYNPYNIDFSNGYPQEDILLDFNVDGVIYRLI